MMEKQVWFVISESDSDSESGASVVSQRILRSSPSTSTHRDSSSPGTSAYYALTCVREESLTSSRNSNSWSQRLGSPGLQSIYSSRSSHLSSSCSLRQQSLGNSGLQQHSLSQHFLNPCENKLSHLSQHTLEDISSTRNSLSQYTLPPLSSLEDSLTSVTSDSYISGQRLPPARNLLKDLPNQQRTKKSAMDAESRESQTKTSQDSANQTDDSQNEGSAHVSPSRGFSSDDGSGWRSETTETSDGNLSLSQYPLEGEDGATNDVHLNPDKEEFLSSAISEVSRDFISGNFSTSKYPAGSGESDSLSDGDHQGEPHQSGAVYARYPESATGLSDCEWNPYATESDNNHTPRSSASEGSPTSAGITSTATINLPDPLTTKLRGHDEKTYQDRNNAALDNGKVVKRKSPEEGGNVSRSVFDEEYRLALQQPVSSYVLYQPESRSSTTGSSDPGRIDGRSVSGSEARYSTSGTRDSVGSNGSGEYRSVSDNQYIPGKHREPSQRVSNYLPDQPNNRQTGKLGNPTLQQLTTEEQRLLVRSGSDSDDTDVRRRPDPIGEISNKPGIAVQRSTMSSDEYQSGGSKDKSGVRKEVPLRGAASRDPVRIMASSGSGGDLDSESKLSYLPVEERNKLLGYTRSLELGEDRQKKSTDVEQEEPDALSQRVAKLLTDANQLGSTLHQSLYDKDSLGLSEKEDFPKYKFSPVKPGLSTPSPTFSSAGPMRPEELQRVKSQAGDDLTGSLRSSLGEEVAKLMAKTDAASGKLKEQKPSPPSGGSSFRPISVQNKPQETATSEGLQQQYTQQKMTRPGNDKESHSRHGSEESQETVDSLDLRVKEILQKTSYVEKMQPPAASYRKAEGKGTGGVTAVLDYSLLQRDLQEIQNSLDPHVKSEEKSDIDKTTDTNALLESFKFGSENSEVESTKSGARKLLWDHAGDLGIDDSATGHFVGTRMTPDSRGSLSTNTTGKFSQKIGDDMLGQEQAKNDSAVSDVVSEQMDSHHGNVAADVEEIIARYQGKSQGQPKFTEVETNPEDKSGLANRVFKILTQEPPERQATGILERAMQQERELLQKYTDRQRLDGSYDLDATDASFAPRDQDIRKQLEWSEMSSLDAGYPDKTGISEMSFKKVTDAPFSALGNAKIFLSSQLQKTSERTFDHSVELCTPYRRAIECYPVYGIERDDQTQKGVTGQTREGERKEAWPERKAVEEEIRRREREKILSQNPLASERFFLTSLDTLPVTSQRRYSDPRDLSPDARFSPERDGHTRSKSEESRNFRGAYDGSHHSIQPAASLTDRRIPSSRYGLGASDSQLEGTHGKRETFDTTPPDNSPGSGGSPGDSDASTSRRSGSSKLRPYRPAGSKELYYTESADETSIADSVTTAESTHTGSDDAIGPYLPLHHLGSRKEVTPSPGIYGNKKSTDGLSTIDERSLSGDREKLGHDRVSSRGSNPGSDLDKRDSGLELSAKTATSYDRMDRPGSRTSDRQSDRSNASSRNWDRMSAKESSTRYPGLGAEDSQLSMTTRSDPGDQFATPKRRRDNDTSTTTDLQISRREVENFNRDMPKSRSETDLVTLNPGATHKSSSPMHGARLMDLSAQPSPILSHHTTLTTPNVQLERKYDEDRYAESRVRQLPLEVGPDYVEAITKPKDDDDDLRDRNTERVEYSRPWDTVPDPLSRKSIEYKPAEKSLGPTDTYQSIKNSERAKEYQRTIDMGRELLNTRPPEIDRNYYVPDRPLERGQESERREICRPLEKGPDYDRTEEKRPGEIPTMETGYATGTVTEPSLELPRVPSEERLLNRSSERENSLERKRASPTERSRESIEAVPKTTPADIAKMIDQERGRPLDRGADYLDMFIPRSIEDPNHPGIVRDHRSRSRSQERRERSRSPATHISEDSTLKHYNIDGEIYTELPQVPDDDFEEMVKAERLKVRKELEMLKLMKQKGKVLTEEELKEFGAEYDCIPPSRRAVALREKLEKDCARGLPANINELWSRFQEMNDTQSDSSMNTSRIEDLTSLLRNPTKHFVQRALDERTYQKVKERRVAEEIAAMEREQRQGRKEELSKVRKQVRDDESNGSYAEILASQERKKKRKDKGEKGKKEQENIRKGSAPEIKKLGDSADTLYSIPEDTSFEGSRRSSPNVNDVKKQVDKAGKSPKQKRQKHVIDPLMIKLKDKVQRQRDKIDKERRKELKRLEKLKKLETLLTAKKKGQLTDKAIDVELENVSSTSVAVSEESSTFMDSTESTLTDDSNRASVNTSSKDSSIELQKMKVRKPKEAFLKDTYREDYDSTLTKDDSCESEIIVVRKPRRSRSDKHGAKEKGRKSKTEHVARYILEKEEHMPNQSGRYKYESVSPSREKFRMETSPVRGKKIRDVGTMYPSPIVVSPPTRRYRPDTVCMRSEAIQTEQRASSPSYDDTGVIPVPLMSPECKRKSKSASPSSSAKGRLKSSSVLHGKGRRSRSPKQRTLSPDSTSNKSSIFNRSYSPPRSRSPQFGSRSTESKSRSRSPPKSRMFVPDSDSEYEKYITSTPPKNRMFTPETPDDELAGKVKDSPRGLAWYIPMDKEVKPWRKPLKEQQAHAVSKEPWQPKSIDPRKWKNLVNTDVLNISKGKNTQFDLDPSGHPLDKTLEDRNSDEENIDPGPRPKIRTKMSLQEAFQIYKQDTISHLRARQKRVALSTEERRLQKVLEKERNELFAEQRKKEANPEAHPYSENLHLPKKRVMSKEEMKELTQKYYKKLPEVVEQKKQKKRAEDYELNRLKARVFNRRVQRSVLNKKSRGHKC